MAGAGSQGQCQLDSSLASAKITVLVNDDDGGSITSEITVPEAARPDRVLGGGLPEGESLMNDICRAFKQ